MAPSCAPRCPGAMQMDQPCRIFLSTDSSVLHPDSHGRAPGGPTCLAQGAALSAAAARARGLPLPRQAPTPPHTPLARYHPTGRPRHAPAMRSRETASFWRLRAASCPPARRTKCAWRQKSVSAGGGAPASPRAAAWRHAGAANATASNPEKELVEPSCLTWQARWPALPLPRRPSPAGGPTSPICSSAAASPIHGPLARAVTALCRAVKAHCLALGLPKRGVAPLRAAVGKLCPSTDHLSPIHADCFQL